MKHRSRVLLGLVSLALAGSVGWYFSSMPSPTVSSSERKPSTAETKRVPSVPAPVAEMGQPPTVARPSLPAGVVKVPAAHPLAPKPVSEFRDWAARYFLAEPEQRTKLIAEGQKLADAHRVALGQIIPTDPKLALDNAVPMVVRQDLPPEIVSKLEKRVNTRGQMLVAGVVPLEGGASVQPIRRSFSVEAKEPGEKRLRYAAYVYGGREGQHTLEETRVSGVAVDGSLAVLDSSVRQLEVGERPDPAKILVTACPISGIETVVEKTLGAVPPPITEQTPALEDDTTVRLVCSGGHIQEYASKLTEEERQAHWKRLGVAAEGSSGGGIMPFNPPPGWTTGTSSILYIRCAFPEQGSDPQSEEQCYDNLRRTTDFFMENSRGRLYLVPTVAPLVVLPYPESWYNASRDGNNQPDGDFVIYDHAREISRRLGYDTDNFDLDVVRWENGPGSYGGLGSVGGKLVILKTNAVGVLMHELGHNMGLMHSNYWQTNPPSSTGRGQNVEYGNIFDVMGNSGSLGHYVAPHKAAISWLTPDQYHDVRSNGLYRIYQTDQGQADAGKRYALRVERDSERNYWLEMRQQFTNQPALFGGLMLTWDSWGYNVDNSPYGSNRGAQLIDTTPGSGSIADTRNDAAIAVGRTFSDPAIDLHMTPILKGGTVPPYIDVIVNRGPFPGNQAPTLALSGPSTLNQGEAGTFVATGSDPDGDAVSYAWDFGDGTFSTDGLPTQSKAWAVDRDTCVTCTITDMKGKRAIRGLVVKVGTGGAGFVVSGTITDSVGNSIQGLYVANRALTAAPAQANVATFRYAITDSNGLYTFTDLPSGNITITPHQPPYTFSPNFPSPLTVSADSTGRNLQMSAGPSGNLLTVTVTDGTAQEAAGAGRTAIITLTRSATSGTLDVPFMVGSNGTAIRNTDYTLTPAPAVVNNTGGGLRYQFANNVGTIAITLTAIDDSSSEGEEYAVLEFPDAVTNYSRVGPTTVTIPIADNDTGNSVVTLLQSEPSSSEAGDTASFILRRNSTPASPLANPLTVNLTYSGVAVLDTDFFAPTSVVIPGGSASTTFTISAFDDIYAEGTEFGTISLASSATYERDTQQRTAQLYITDNDQPVLTVAATDAVASEAGDTGKFTITRAANDLSQPLTVQFSLGGSALPGKDYRRVDGSAVIPAHELSVDVDVVPIDDGVGEPSQSVILRLATDDAYAITAPGSATVDISDNDTSEISIRTLLVANSMGTRNYTGRILEPNAGPPLVGPATKAVFEVSRRDAGNTLTVPIDFTGTATKGADYNSVPSSVSIPSGQTSGIVSITIVDDAIQEDTETIIATIPPGSYRLTNARSATAFILDGDQPTVDVSLEDKSSDLTPIRENDGTFRFFVGRTNADVSTTYSGDLPVPFTLSGTATVGTDYTATASPVTILDGQAGAYITITLINDTVGEGTETLTVSLNSSGAYGRGTATATALIEDNDAFTGASPPSVQFATTATTITERTGASGATTLTIPVNITGTRSGPVTVNYLVSSGTATGEGVDYTLTPGTLTFAITDTVKNISVVTTPDIFPEGNEYLVISLTNNVGTNIGNNDTHTVTISDISTPEALTDTIGNLPGTTATLRGRAVANGIATTAWFEWGTNGTSFPNSTPPQSIGTGTNLVSLTDATITGLVYPGTYYYRTVARNTIGTTVNTVRGITRTIRTATAPVGSTLPTTIHDFTTATLLGSLNPNRINAEIWFEWGTTTAYGNVTRRQGVVASTVPVTVSQAITGLAPNTIYHYRLNALTSLGSVVGADMTVATVPHRIAGDLIVNLTARDASAATANWSNFGSLAGVFAAAGTPVRIADVSHTEVPGVQFDGFTRNYTGPTATADISGNDSRTLEAWVFNPGLGSADDIVSLGQTGSLTESTLRYNNDAARGALTHDGAANDAGYPAAALPSLGKWHHLVYTYNGSKVAKLYIDGALKITKSLSANLATTVGTINLGTVRTAAGPLTGGTFSGYLNSLRIHGGELSATDVTTNFNLGPDAPPAVPGAPYAETKGASSVSTSGALINAVVTPRGLTTTAWVEWGTSTSYDNASAPQSVGSAWAPFALAVPLGSLADGIEYHFRVAAQNAAGTVYGDDKVFTTGAAQNAGILWVDLRATDATAGTATWHNRGGLGNFARVGAPSLVANAGSTGIPGVQFNGTTDVYESFALADADISFNSDRTLELWVLNPSLLASDEGPLSLGRAAGRHQQFVPLINQIKAWTDNTTQGAWPSPPLVGAWHHLVLVHFGTNAQLGTSVQLYLDGALINSTAIPEGIDTVDDSVVLGASRDGVGGLSWATTPFDGFINCVRVHGGALSASQISANYLAGPYYTASSGVVPTATTLTPPSLVTGTSATLRATVMPGAIAATGWIQWGTVSGALTNSTPAVALPNAFATTTLNEPIGGLTSGTTYYYRAAALNTNGPAYGAEQSFTASGAVTNLPTAVTNDATAVLIKTATLNGVATPGNLAANAWFEYGPSGSFASVTTKTPITAVTPSKVMTAPLSALKPHTTYSFRLVCENATGKVVGAVKTFTTGNTTPVATAGSLVIKEDTATVLALKGSDADGETLSLVLVTPPGHGMLTGTSLAPLYTPQANYTGADSFTFGVSDGGPTPSNVVTFGLTITAVADGPLAQNGAVSGNEDTVINGNAVATDPEGDPVVSFAIATSPANGDVTISNVGAYSYTPNPNFNGIDSFTFTATNPGGTSAPGMIIVTVNPLADTPEADDATVSTPVSTSKSGQATGFDADDDALTFALGANASHGNATINAAGSWSYAPTNGYVGNDSFTFTVNDGSTTSAPATITIVVGGPIANAATFTGTAGDSISGTLTGTGTGTLTFTVVDEPLSGSVTLNTNGTFVFNPDGNDIGTDTFTFMVNNGTLDSPPATVTLVLVPRPPNWAWIGGASTVKKPGTYGALNVAAPANTPGARSGFGAILDGTSNTLLFGGSGIGSAATPGLLNDVWRQDPDTGEWTWRKGSSVINAQGNYGAQGLTSATSTPGARSDFAYWKGNDGKLWIFGGSGRDSTATGNGLLNDLWSYDPTTNNWTWIKGSSFINANGTYGTKNVSASTNSPGARSGACAWVQADGSLWLFGGNGRGATGITVGGLNDLWKYDPALNRWTWISGSSLLDANGTYGSRGLSNGASIPSGRSFATAWCEVDGKFYLFGGTGKGATLTTKGNLNDLWSYDPLSNAWTWLTGSSAVNGVATYGTLGLPNLVNTPGARSGGTALVDGTSNTLLFGGQATSGVMNDVWRYDSVAGQWTWIKGPSTANGAATYGTLGTPAPGNTPGARRGSAAIQDGLSNTILIGGTNAANSNNDQWSLEGNGLPVIRSVGLSNLTATDGTSNTILIAEETDTSVVIDWWPLTSPSSVSSTTAQTVSAGFDEQTLNTNISGLTGGTAYLMRIRATNAAGTTYSKPLAFTSLGSSPAVTAEFALATSTVSEVAGWASAAVKLSGPAPADFNITVAYSGTASAADYTAGATTLLISKGQTGAVISVPLVNDGLDESDETISLALSAPTGGVTLGANAAHTITLTDDEITPVINAQPASVFVKTGVSTTFTVSAAGSSLLYQWKKNGANITGATSASYTIASPKTTDAANYTCEVKNSLATLLSSTAELFVVDITPLTKVQATGNTSFTVNAVGPTGTTIAYAWNKGLAPIADIPGHRTGAATKTLTFTGLLSTDSDTYTCTVSKQGAPLITSVSGNFILAVPNLAPSITPGQTLPVGVVNIPYSYQVLIDNSLLKTPTTFTAPALPAGLTINATGLISGKTSTALSAKPITITATNASGTSTLSTTTLTILALPTEAVGDFVGLADRSAPNSNLGARLDLTTTALGAYTAKLIYQNATISATGSLGVTLNGGSTAVTNIGATATFARAGKPSVIVTFASDLSTHGFTGTITDPLVGPVVNFTGWHRKWSLIAPQASSYAGYYTTAFEIPQHLVGDEDIPQGSSYGSFTITNDGKLTLAGKTADGLSFSVATLTGPSGQLPFFAPFITSPGSLIGELSINSTTSDVSGILTWTKGAAPTTSKDMAYRAGFGPVSLNADGGKLPVIAAGGVFMQLPNVDDNALIDFSEGGLLLGDVDPVEFSIRNLSVTGTAQKVTVLTNTAKLTFVPASSPVGSFSGSFTIPNATAALVRKVTFQGTAVHNSTVGYRSAGYFLLPRLPQPGQTLSTAPVLSGSVELGENVP